MPMIKVNGMSCKHCVASVTKALQEIDGVSDINVDLGKGQASYTTDKDIDVDIIKEAIKKIGFEAQ